MIFTATGLEGAWLIDVEKNKDERGFFARTWCRQEFAARGLDTEIVQESLSYNRYRGTLRGLHFQRSPHGETKIVRCTHGEIFDVIVDLRPSSPSYFQWRGFRLAAEYRRAIYIPKGFAHGFQALTDDAEIAYQMSTSYVREASCGCRYDDPALNISWPLPVSLVHERDLSWPALASNAHTPAM